MIWSIVLVTVNFVPCQTAQLTHINHLITSMNRSSNEHLHRPNQKPCFTKSPIQRPLPEQENRNFGGQWATSTNHQYPQEAQANSNILSESSPEIWTCEIDSSYPRFVLITFSHGNLLLLLAHYITIFGHLYIALRLQSFDSNIQCYRFKQLLNPIPIIQVQTQAFAYVEQNKFRNRVQLITVFEANQDHHMVIRTLFFTYWIRNTITSKQHPLNAGWPIYSRYRYTKDICY